MKATVKVLGLRQLDAALGELPRATGKAVLRRIAKKALTPFADAMRELAPVDTGALRDSIGVSAKLTRRQRSQHRKTVKDDKSSVEMFAGAGGLTQAVQDEFGNVHQAARPFARPAWDANKDKALDIIANDLGDEIQAAAKRLARKAAKLKG